MPLLECDKLPKELTQQYSKINRQARRHTSLDGFDDLIESVRPSESKESKEERVRNERHITMTRVQAVMQMLARVLFHSGMNLTDISPELQTYLSQSPFIHNKKELDLITWISTVALWQSVEDPNGLFLYYPEKENFNSTLTKAVPRVRFIASDQVIGTVNYNLNNKGLEVYTYIAIEIYKQTFHHILVNKNRIIELTDNDKGIPIIDYWYDHGFGIEPLQSPPSYNVSFKKYDVNISLLWTMFPYLDEAASQFSDSQKVSKDINFAIPIIKEMDCPSCSGKGFIDLPEKKRETCQACNGGKIVTKLTPYTVLVNNGDAGDVGSQQAAPVSYITPPYQLFPLSYDRAFDLMDKGDSGVGMITVEAANVESGLSRGFRFEKKQEFLHYVAGLVKMFTESTLWYFERYININSKFNPTAVFPTQLSIMDAETLLLLAKDALFPDRYKSYIDAFTEKYKGDDKTLRTFKIAFKISQAFILNEDELTLRYNAGIYTRYDVYVRDVVWMTVSEVLETFNDPKIEDKVIIEKAKEIMLANSGDLSQKPEPPKPALTPNLPVNGN